MKKTLTTISVLILSTGSALALDGFYGSKWGMTEQAVQTLYRGAVVPYTTQGVDGTQFPHVGFPRYEVDGCDFYVDFKFDGGRLSRVEMGLNGFDQIACPTKVSDALAGKYGSSRLDEPSRGVYSQDRRQVWFAGATKITTFSTFFPALNRTMMSIRYEPLTSGSGRL